MWKRQDVVRGFVRENPARLAAAELSVAESWVHVVAGQFVVAKCERTRAIFLSQEKRPKGYGVLGLMSSVKDVLRSPPPALVEAALLPFEGKIVFDGLMLQSGITFGPGYRSGLRATADEIVQRGELITSLPECEMSCGLTGREIRRVNEKLLLAFVRAELHGRMSLRSLRTLIDEVADVGAAERVGGTQATLLARVTREDIAEVVRGLPGSRSTLRRLVRFLVGEGVVKEDAGRALLRVLEE